VVGLRICESGGACITHLRSISEHPQNGLRDYFGILRAGLCISATICSHFEIAVETIEIKKPLIS